RGPIRGRSLADGPEITGPAEVCGKTAIWTAVWTFGARSRDHRPPAARTCDGGAELSVRYTLGPFGPPSPSDLSTAHRGHECPRSSPSPSASAAERATRSSRARPARPAASG